MNAFCLLGGVVLAGRAAQVAVSCYRDGRLDLSWFWYLALGLYLMIRFFMSRPNKSRIVERGTNAGSGEGSRQGLFAMS
jgi:hypothetical protein